MGNLFKGGLFDNSPPQINPDQNLGMGNNNMLPPNSPHAMMSNMHDQNAMLKMYEQYNKPSFSQKLSDLGAAFRAAGAAPSQQGSLWNQLNQTRANRTSDIRNRFKQLQQDNRQQTLDKQNLRNTQFNQNMATDRFNLSTKQFEFNEDKYNNSQDLLDQKNALIGDNFFYTQGQAPGVTNKSISVMDQMGNPETIYPGDPRYNYYNSALKAKEKATEQKLLQKTSGVSIKGKKDVIWDKKQNSYRYLNSGEITRDKEFTKKYEKWRPSQHAANVATLSTIADSLSSGDVELGGLSRALSMMDPNNTTYIRAILDTKGLDTQERVLQVVQQSLRETLGAQFTAKEAENLLNRSYNPALPQAINAKRLKFLATITKQMGDLTSQKIDYFNENKTLAGFDEAGFDKKITILKQQLENYYDVLDKEAKNSSNSSNRSVGGKSSTGIKFKIK